MKERPIIMTAESVRAILAGAKSQTRRLIDLREFGPSDTHGYDWTFRDRKARWQDFETARLIESKWCRFHVGDRLWVKETWTHDADSIDEAQAQHEDAVSASQVYYRASLPNDEAETFPRWVTPPYMPRWASRLTLEVVEVRVQRLQEISEGDARAEGCRGVRGAVGQLLPGPPRTAREGYERAWDRINGKRVPWAGNPWVWAITFQRLP